MQEMLPFCQFISNKTSAIQISKDPGIDLALLLLTIITLTMDKVSTGASKVISAIKGKNKSKVSKGHAGKMNTMGSEGSITDSNKIIFSMCKDHTILGIYPVE